MTITNRNGKKYIFYDKSQEIKSAENLSFLFLLFFISVYLLFRNVDSYKYLIYIFFYPIISYIRIAFFSKMLIIFNNKGIKIQKIVRNKIIKEIYYSKRDIRKISLFEKKVKGSQKSYILKIFINEKTATLLESVCKSDMRELLEIFEIYIYNDEVLT